MEDQAYDNQPTTKGMPDPQSGIEADTRPPQQDLQQQGDKIYLLPINLTFVQSPSGIFKVLQLVLGLIAWACVIPYVWIPANVWVLFVTMTVWFAGIINYIIFACNVTSKITFLNWGWEEVTFNGACAVLYFTAAITVSIKANGRGALIAACIFIWFNLILFCVNTVFSLRQAQGRWPWENISSASGGGSDWSTEQQTNSSTTTSAPAYEVPI